jgi:hypothetical protein
VVRISLELVPRSVASLEADLAPVRERLPAITTVTRAGDHALYFMPIRVDVAEYLEGLLQEPR